MYVRNVDTRRSYKAAVKAITEAINGAGGKTLKSRSEKLRRRFFGTYAQSLFTDVHAGFMVKSKGLPDECGERWPPLKPATIAARPITRADMQKYKISATRGRGLLTKQQDALWRRIFKLKFDQYFWGNTTHDEAKAKAAKFAWWFLKNMGAKTRKDTLSKRKVPILIETGKLERSLRPGRMNHWSYVRYNKDQVYEIRGKQMEIGTKVSYASKHQKGTATVPARRIFPEGVKMKKWTLRAARRAAETMADTLAEELG